MTDTEKQFPADWAIEEALEPFNAAPDNERPVPVTVGEAKCEARSLGYAASIIAHARLIEKFQPALRPVDPLLIEARKIVADVNGERDLADRYWQTAVIEGGHDGCLEIGIALAALRRGKELAA